YDGSSMLVVQRAPRCLPVFPYTTLFRSRSRAVFGDLQVGGWAALSQSARVEHLARRRESTHDSRLQNFRRRLAHRLRQATRARLDRKSTRLNSSHVKISYAVFCLKKKNP